MKIIYIMDVLCGWSHISNPFVNKLYQDTEYQDTTHKDISWEVFDLALFTNKHVPNLNPGFIAMVETVIDHAKKVGGGEFTPEYINLLKSKDFDHDSTLSAKAFATMKIIDTSKLLAYYTLMQSKLFIKGENINKVDVLIELASEIVAKDKFTEVFKSKVSDDLAESDHKEAYKILHARGKVAVPALLLKKADKYIELDAYSVENSLNIINNNI